MSAQVLASPAEPSASVFSHFSLAKKKTAIVTGGTRGIGLEVARGLAEAGARVAITYSSMDQETANATAASLAGSTGQEVHAFRADSRSPSEISNNIRFITAEFLGGRLDIVVANAGIASHHAAEDYTPEQFQDIINVNLNGAFYTAQEAGRLFKEQFGDNRKYEGQGKVLFTASVSAILVNISQKQSAYNASKAAVVQLAKCLAVEWIGFARVNCLSPGFIATDMLKVHPEEWRKKWFSLIPAGRVCEAAELKAAYVFPASDAT